MFAYPEDEEVDTLQYTVANMVYAFFFFKTRDNMLIASLVVPLSSFWSSLIQIQTFIRSELRKESEKVLMTYEAGRWLAGWVTQIEIDKSI